MTKDTAMPCPYGYTGDVVGHHPYENQTLPTLSTSIATPAA